MARTGRERRTIIRRAAKVGYTRLVVFTGPMKSGKSAELISSLSRYQHAGLEIHVFFPETDTRAEADRIASRLGIHVRARPVASAGDLLASVPPSCDIVAIDEAQFFPDAAALVSAVRELVSRGVLVLVAGLDLDFAERPFGAMAELCALADHVEKLTAICAHCQSAFATRTQRLVNGKPATLESPAVLVEGSDDAVVYEARCHLCYERPAPAPTRSTSP